MTTTTTTTTTTKMRTMNCTRRKKKEKSGKRPVTEDKLAEDRLIGNVKLVSKVLELASDHDDDHPQEA